MSAFSDKSPVIRLDNVSVSFPIYQLDARSLKKRIMFRGTGGHLARDANHRVVVEALRNVSLSIAAGDRVALVGGNGAGKTTLLRAIAGVYEPFTGEVYARGRISPLFDIALGIDNDLSGYENIKLRGMLLGLSSSEIEQYMEDIVEFTELGDYLEIPMRTYSSGMMTRLTFAVATCFAPEILLMDEWIMAGDVRFLAKAQARVASFVDRASILILASHNLEICRKWCSKAIWMDNGRVRMFDELETVLMAYSSSEPSAA